MSERRVNNLLAKIVATGLGSGYSPVASGTVGSALCLVIWLALFQLLGGIGLALQAVMVLIVTALGLLSTSVLLSSLDPQSSARFSKPKDPSIVVIDEWAGMLIALFGAWPYDLIHVSIAFVTFRLFDVIKPEPARRCEKFSGAWGIMADDLVAGVYAALATWVISYLLLSM